MNIQKNSRASRATLRNMLSALVATLMAAAFLFSLTSCSLPGSGESSDNSEATFKGTDLNNVPRDEKGQMKGYIESSELPDSSLFLAQPPTNGTPEKASDEDIAKNMTDNFYGTDRWALSALDASLAPDDEACHFNCAIGVTVSKEETPHLYTLLLRSAATSSDVSTAMKKAQMRQRPFAQAGEASWGPNSDKTCRPDEEAILRTNGSYPSGHTSIGYVMGLVLAGIDPADSTKIMQRARQYAESRVVCNAHWYTDTQAGREIAATALSQLSANETYRADFEAAATEFKAAKEKMLTEGRQPTKNYKLTPESNDPEIVSVIEDINTQLLNWDCSKEQEVLDNFNIMQK